MMSRDEMLTKLETMRAELTGILKELPTYPYNSGLRNPEDLRNAYASGTIREAVTHAHEGVSNARVVLNVYGEHVE